MHPYPHVYVASATAEKIGTVTVSSPRLPNIETAPPAEFDGPGDVWSPETLLCAAVADCFILTFRGVSRAAKLEWLTLECSVEGTLQRADGISKFTRYATRATLTVPAGADIDHARRLLERAEHTCLISNSLQGERTLEANVLRQNESAASP
jgi:organic hydroperoxide reductase OsmC/OhrA